jgi:hypothetical protein
MENCPAKTLFPAKGCPAYRSSPVDINCFDTFETAYILVKQRGIIGTLILQSNSGWGEIRAQMGDPIRQVFRLREIWPRALLIRSRRPVHAYSFARRA